MDDIYEEGEFIAGQFRIGDSDEFEEKYYVELPVSRMTGQKFFIDEFGFMNPAGERAAFKNAHMVNTNKIISEVNSGEWTNQISKRLAQRESSKFIEQSKAIQEVRSRQELFAQLPLDYYYYPDSLKEVLKQVKDMQEFRKTPKAEAEAEIKTIEDIITNTYAAELKHVQEQVASLPADAPEEALRLAQAKLERLQQCIDKDLPMLVPTEEMRAAARAEEEEDARRQKEDFETLHMKDLKKSGIFEDCSYYGNSKNLSNYYRIGTLGDYSWERFDIAENGCIDPMPAEYHFVSVGEMKVITVRAGYNKAQIDPLSGKSTDDDPERRMGRLLVDRGSMMFLPLDSAIEQITENPRRFDQLPIDYYFHPVAMKRVLESLKYKFNEDGKITPEENAVLQNINEIMCKKYAEYIKDAEDKVKNAPEGYHEMDIEKAKINVNNWKKAGKMFFKNGELDEAVDKLKEDEQKQEPEKEEKTIQPQEEVNTMSPLEPQEKEEKIVEVASFEKEPEEERIELKPIEPQQKEEPKNIEPIVSEMVSSFKELKEEKPEVEKGEILDIETNAPQVVSVSQSDIDLIKASNPELNMPALKPLEDKPSNTKIKVDGDERLLT